MIKNIVKLIYFSFFINFNIFSGIFCGRCYKKNKKTIIELEKKDDKNNESKYNEESDVDIDDLKGKAFRLIKNDGKTLYFEEIVKDVDDEDYAEWKDKVKFIEGYLDEDHSNHKFNQLLVKYLKNKGLNYDDCEFDVKNVYYSRNSESLKCRKKYCKEVIIKDKDKNEDVVYLKKCYYINKLKIDLLKYLKYCDLEYTCLKRSQKYILTKKVTDDVKFYEYLNDAYLNKSAKILEKTKNLVPYYITMSFLGCDNCGTLKLFNNYFTKINNDEYLIKALSFGEYDYSNIKDYYDICNNLNGFNDVFFKILEFNYKNKIDEDLKKFLYFTLFKKDHFDDVSIDFYKKKDGYWKFFYYVYSNKFSYKDLEYYLHKKICDNHFDKKLKDGGTHTCYKGDDDDYEKKLFIEDDIGCDKHKNFNENINTIIYIFENNFKSKFQEFFKDFITVAKMKYEDKEREIKGKDNIEIYTKFYNDTNNKLQEFYNFYEKVINLKYYLIERIKKITKDEKKETIEKINGMLDFLINNKNNNQYEKKCIDEIIKNIKEVQKSTLFPFIFEDENIKNKIENL